MESIKNKFDIINLISDSQDSQVFHAQRKDTNDFFLIKSLKKQKDTSKNIIDRNILFRKEINITSSLDHPNIVKLADTYFDGKTYYIIYPYREGKTLSNIFKDGQNFSTRDSLNLILQLLDALEYIHLKGIIHSDINPNNIFVDYEKGVTLIDFGYSMTEEEAVKLPEGTIVGTPPYLSLEQSGLTDYKIDARSDLFCTALILYRLLSGKLPFSIENDSIEELLNKLPKVEVEPIKELPAILNAILIKALKPSPDDRYQTATGLKYDLKVALEILNEKHIESFIVGEIDNIATINRKTLFVARENELDALKKGLDQSSKGNTTSFLFYGKSGIGKTYLINQFRTKINENVFFFLASECNRFTPAQPYSIYRHIILEFISKISSCSNEEIEQFKLVMNNNFIEYSGIICMMIPEMKDFFIETREISKVEKEKEADMINHVLTFFLNTLCDIKPSIIFIDDFQWIDQTTFEIIRNVLKTMPQGMMIFNFRTEKSDEDIYMFGINLRKIGVRNIIPVSKFLKNEIKELIFSRFGDIEESDALVEILSSKTDAYPFTLTEAIRHLVNNFILRPAKQGWHFNKNDLNNLPDKFDTASLILSKLNWLNEEEKKYLKLASLIEGNFARAILEKFGEFNPETSKSISNRLENLGFIFRQLSGSYSFTHDKVKEAISESISKNDRFELNEKLAQIYESLIQSNKEYLFNATECYLKSKNLTKSIEFCHKAATYAVEKVAFDGAIHYFKFTLLMASQCPLVNIPVPIDMIKVQVAFGDVLMLSGRNQQALNIFQKLTKDCAVLSENQFLELKYKIGSIYHNLGEFDNSIPYFKDALSDLGIKFPVNRIKVILALLSEIVIQFFFSPLLIRISKKKNDFKNLLKVRILNKLTYSIYFDDMFACLFANFKALNLADRIVDSVEKADAYTIHGVPVYQLLMKKRAFKYLRKSLRIAGNINRKDCYAFAQSISGLDNYFYSNWKKSEYSLHLSINIFSSIGDITNQILSAEHLWRVKFMRGDFNKAIDYINTTINLCELTKEKHFLMATLAAQYLISLLKTGNTNESDVKKIENMLKQTESFLSHTHVGMFLIQAEILQNRLHKAYRRIKALLPVILRKSFNSEYIVPAYTLYCELIIHELQNRREGNAQIPIPEKKLKKDFYIYLFILWFSCLSFPAYWGAFYRSLAWHNSLKGRKKKAKKYFLKAIQKHHSLDMRYEEAKSIRDYGLFLDDCNLPGEARDQYNAAYKLFHICGAKLETDRLKEKVDYDTKTLNVETLSEKEEEKKLVSTIKTANQLRVDTLYNVSSSITELDDINLLFKQILNAMILATGAQYAWLFLEGSERYDIKEICIDYNGKTHNKKDIPFSRNIVNRVKEERNVVLIKNVSQDNTLHKGGEETGRIGLIRSVLCVPLCHLDNYLGCVYLGNNIVSGLFNEESKKIVQILSAQAGILLENAYIMGEHKKLNKHLKQRVNEQTKDIKENNIRLIDTNLKLMDSERMKNILTGTIVHDIKNYAAGIEGNISVLSRKHPENHSIKRTLSLVKNTCFDIVNLTSNLLDIGKMEESKLEPNKTLIYYDQICKIISQFKDNVLFDERNISVEIIPPMEKFIIEADIYLLTRVFQNLFNNAAKYVPKNGKVVISMESGTEEDTICFFSSGNPIPEKDKYVIFDKYSSLDNNRSLHSKGLGLFFCRLVINVHQGRIWLETDEKGNYFKLAFQKIPVTTTV